MKSSQKIGITQLLSTPSFGQEDSCSQGSENSYSEQSSDDPLQAGKIDFHNDLTTIGALKFQNTEYRSGDHIGLRTDPKDEKQIYGKILLIGKVPQAQFPLIYVAWHYSKFEGFAPGSAPSYLSDRQLVASNHKDWQYIESITKKIKVLKLNEYQELDYRSRQSNNMFFMRSYLDFETNQPVPCPRIVCHCLKLYNPDEKLASCCVCEFQFHPMCARHEYLCISCQ